MQRFRLFVTTVKQVDYSILAASTSTFRMGTRPRRANRCGLPRVPPPEHPARARRERTAKVPCERNPGGSTVCRAHINDSISKCSRARLCPLVQNRKGGGTSLTSIFLPAEVVDRFQFREKMTAGDRRRHTPAKGKPVLLGISTKASLSTDSFSRCVVAMRHACIDRSPRQRQVRLPARPQGERNHVASFRPCHRARILPQPREDRGRLCGSEEERDA